MPSNALVRLKGKSERSVRFPFARSAAEFDDQLKESNLRRAGPEVVEAIRSLKPHKEGNAALRYIHDLDVIDKHQMMLPVMVHIDWNNGATLLDHRALISGRLSSGIWQVAAPSTLGTAPARISLVIPIDAPILSHDHHWMINRPPKLTEVLHGFVKELSGILDSFELLCFGAVSK